MQDAPRPQRSAAGVVKARSSILVKMGRVQLLLLGFVCCASAFAAADPLLRQQHEQELLGAKVCLQHSGLLLMCAHEIELVYAHYCRQTRGKRSGSG